MCALLILADDGCPHVDSVTETPADAASLCRAIAELERAFRVFAESSFKRQLPMPVITIQTKGRSRALGWFAQERWQNGQPAKLPEINISAEHLDGGVDNIAETLLHEMCHYVNYLDGLRDCTSSQYHNRHFLRRCESIRLNCRKLGRRGWASTELSPELREVVRGAQLDPEAFAMYRAGPQYRLVTPQPERRLRRWTCACKKSKVIYASRGLEVTCTKCLKCYAESPLH